VVGSLAWLAVNPERTLAPELVVAHLETA
jgi:hypothetical protein